MNESDYRILVSRAGDRSRARYWPVSLREPLPPIGIPLRQPDEDATLELNKALQAAYERGAYDLSINYGKKPEQPLTTKDWAWAQKLSRKWHQG